MYAVTLYNTYVRHAVALLGGVVAVSAFLYGGLLLGAVAHAAGRTAAEHEVQRLSSEVSHMESTYLTLTKSLSPARAAELGFVQPVSVTTVYAGTSGLTLAGVLHQ